MLTTPLKAFLFAAASVAALATVAYVSGALDRFIQAPSQTIAALPEPDAPADPTAKGDRPHQPSLPATDAPATEAAPDGTAAQSPSAPEIVPPSFDLVRVEAGGSLVVAGNAAPGSQIELLTGSKVIGSAVAGSEGDFAVVLDEPLEPGAYQIVLRATDAGGVVAMSPETAVVSVPDQQSGQVLALVEKPGEPSKLLTVPEPGTSTDKGATNAQAAEAPAAPEVQAGVSTGEPPAPAEAGTDIATAEDDGQAAADAAAPSAQAAREAAVPAQSEATSQPQAPSEQQVASAPAQEPAASVSAAPSAAAKVKVEAVEIEGNQVFVAGLAEPGALVRVYANDIFLGETRAAPGGQFLVEAMRELAVGDYIIRADVVADDGSTVIVRATVPFQREPGESISAVAAPSAAPATSTPPAAVAEAPAGDAASASAGTDGAATQGEAAAPSGAADASGQVASAEAPATNPGAAQEPSGSTKQPSGQTAAAASSGASGAAEPPSVAGDSLQAVDGSVIIRRGDSLWRISRRVYGRGIRYSTIYLANQDQIADPDRIWPGQVFRVPEKTDEGEAADMDAISNRQMPQTAKGDSNTTTR